MFLQCEQDCTIGASGCGVGHMKTTLHLRVLIDHLSPFTSRREELLQQLVIYHLVRHHCVFVVFIVENKYTHCAMSGYAVEL